MNDVHYEEEKECRQLQKLYLSGLSGLRHCYRDPDDPGQQRRPAVPLFGWMAVVLGAGDSFHLVPRALALCTTGLENYTVPLGLGKWITSVTMTVFYVLLYYVWRLRYRVLGRNGLTAAVYGLAGLRIFLCMMPQNRWLSADAPLSWGIYRNIPFALLGLLVIVLFFDSARKNGTGHSDGCGLPLC